jgi:hypothetical protein
MVEVWFYGKMIGETQGTQVWRSLIHTVYSKTSSYLYQNDQNFSHASASSRTGEGHAALFFRNVCVWSNMSAWNFDEDLFNRRADGSALHCATHHIHDSALVDGLLAVGNEVTPSRAVFQNSFLSKWHKFTVRRRKLLAKRRNKNLHIKG